MKKPKFFHEFLRIATIAFAFASLFVYATTAGKFSGNPEFSTLIPSQLTNELDSAWDTKMSFLAATQKWDAGTGLITPSAGQNATLYELNYSMLKACSDYYQSIPPFDALRPAASAPIEDQLEYMLKMKRMAKAIVGGMWGQELPDMTYNDYIRIFTNAQCCPAGTFNRTNHGYNFGKCENCGQGYYCIGGTHRERCPGVGASTPTDKSKSLADCSACPEGRYCPSTDQIRLCGAGKWSAAGSTAQSDCVNGAAGFYYPGDGNKIECPAGQYCVSGVATPANCPVGTYSNPGGTGIDSCIPSLCVQDDGASGVHCSNGTRAACPNGFRYINPTDDTTPRTFANVCFECGWEGASAPATPAEETWGVYTTSNRSAFCRNSFDGSALTTLRTNCPAGTWSNPACMVSVASGGYFATGRCPSIYQDCVDCPQGYFCDLDGIWPYDGNHGCPAGFWCPRGTTDFMEQACPSGTWSDTLSGSLSQCTTAKCGAGNWCESGIKGQCAEGYYCPGNGQMNMCVPGYFCPTGSSALNNMCPNNMWSLPGAKSSADCLPTFCDDGYLCGNAQKTLCPAGSVCVAGLDPEDCPVGKYCTSGTTSDGFGSDTKRPAVDCPAGTWSSAGSVRSSDCQASLCGAGNWCDYGDGAVSGKGICPAGFFCNIQTLSGGIQRVVKTICPAGYFCPSNSASATICPSGTWSTAGRIAADECTPCEDGYRCMNGTKSLCPAGSHCQAGITTICPAGHYCEGGDRYAPRACPVGTWATAGEAHQISDCTANLCGLGYYCENGVREQCEQGYTCGNGAKTLCTAGKYCPLGASQGTNCPNGTWSRPGAWLSTNTINGCLTAECGVGYWCDGSSRYPCGDCTSLDDQSTCPSDGEHKSAYCLGDGAKRICPAGSYCKTGEWQPIACPAGTTSPSGSNKASDCTPCPAGTWSESGDGQCVAEKCPDGYYCDGTLTACAPGTICQNGVRTNCPAGEWSGYAKTTCSVAKCRTGFLCDGTGANGRRVCPAGYFCPNSTTQTICPEGRFCPERSQFGSICPAGTFTNSTGKASSTDCIEMDDGRYYPGTCTAGCTNFTSPDNYNCGAGNFCPAGSSAPWMCPEGTWTSSTTLKSESECTACSAGKWSTEGRTSACSDDCEAGRFCPGDKTNPTCPVGKYCVSGSSAPTNCGQEKFRSALGGTSSTDCSNCPAGTSTHGHTGFASCMGCMAGQYCPGNGIANNCEAGKYCVANQSAATNCPNGTWSAPNSGRIEDCLSVNPSNVLASAINTAAGTAGFSVYPTGTCAPFQMQVSILNGGQNLILTLDDDFMSASGGGYSTDCGIYTISELSGSDNFWGAGRGLAVICGNPSTAGNITSSNAQGGNPRWRVFNTDGSTSKISGWNSGGVITFRASARLARFTLNATTRCVQGFTAN
ncbi:MAG: hypothetical protein LBB23_02780 [Rickettsiales bacterium]|nr:hypothetical protein [Rickettsiales bacterium]